MDLAASVQQRSTRSVSPTESVLSIIATRKVLHLVDIDELQKFTLQRGIPGTTTMV